MRGCGEDERGRDWRGGNGCTARSRNMWGNNKWRAFGLWMGCNETFSGCCARCTLV